MVNGESRRNVFEKLMDNPWLLLVLGVVVPVLFYNVWGWIDLVWVPTANLR
jgi:hypothetical protein